MKNYFISLSVSKGFVTVIWFDHFESIYRKKTFDNLDDALEFQKLQILKDVDFE